MSRRMRGRPGGDGGRDDDEALFQRTMAEVEPLKKKRALKTAVTPDLGREKLDHQLTDR